MAHSNTFSSLSSQRFCRLKRVAKVRRLRLLVRCTRRGMSDAPRMSEVRATACRSCARSLRVRDRLSFVLARADLGGGSAVSAWQPIMLWLTPGAWDPIWIRCVIAALFGLSAVASLGGVGSGTCLRMVHGLACLITAHLFAISAINGLPSGYLMGLFALLAGGGLVSSPSKACSLRGLHVALSVAAAAYANAPLSSRRVFGVWGLPRFRQFWPFRLPPHDRAARAARELERANGASRAALQAPSHLSLRLEGALASFATKSGAGWRGSLEKQWGVAGRKRCTPTTASAATSCGGRRAARTPWEAEFRFLHPDGEVRWVYSRATVVSGEYGAQERVGMTVRHTARKLAEESLTRAKEVAEAPRAPRAILGQDEPRDSHAHERRARHAGAGAGDAAAARSERLCRYGRFSARNLLGIINDILDVSRIEARKLSWRRFRSACGSCSIPRSAADAAGARQGAVVRARLGLHVPDGLVGDALRLQQVLVNLVATPSSSRAPAAFASA